MPKRTDIEKILIVGSGPTVIGQGSEFDYGAAQACAALKAEGYDVVVIDSNPAALATECNTADATYIEPLTVDSLTKTIEEEKPDALLVAFGGQTALRLALSLKEEGVLDKHKVELIGVDADTIAKTEDRKLFRDLMNNAGVPVPRSGVATSVEEGMQVIKDLWFPAILKPAYTSGGAGYSLVYNIEEFVPMLTNALDVSPIHQTLIEESVLGWKEVEFQLVRDEADSVVVVTTLENIDPVGVHSGDSVVVAPTQTLARDQVDELSKLAKKVVRELGVVGAADVRFAMDSETGDAVVLGVNSGMSRTAALASKATGYSVAYVAAMLSVGYTLNEVENELTGHTYASSEPVVDYCAVKIPRFDFDRFPQAVTTLGTSMKATGEALAVGRTFKEALQKAIRSTDSGRFGLGVDGRDPDEEIRTSLDAIRERLTRPNPDTLFFIRYAIENDMTTEEIALCSDVHPWFIENIRDLVEFEKNLVGKSVVSVTGEVLYEAKQLGYSDVQLAELLETTEEQVYMRRKVLDIRSNFYPVDTSAGAYETEHPYFYSTFDGDNQSKSSDNPKKVLVIGGGPNRIGQGIEFDNCVVSALRTLADEGYEAVVINSNPAAVSTDFKVSDRLYLDPVTRENILEVIDHEKPMGVVAQFAGPTGARLMAALQDAGVTIMGTPAEVVARARDRKEFRKLTTKLELKSADGETVTSASKAVEAAERLGYPVVARLSSPGGKKSTDIIYDEDSMSSFLESAKDISYENPVTIDKFLEHAIEVDVDAVCDGTKTVICGVLEHIEHAGIHSGDSACSLPPNTLESDTIDEIKRITSLLAEELGVRGLMTARFAVRDDGIFVLDVTPRASRTIPFTSKATGVDWVTVATKVLLGINLVQQGVSEVPADSHVAVKEVVFPFSRFAGVDAMLGPEMKSTGDVMGINLSFGHAYIKAQLAAAQNLPEKGRVFISVADVDKDEITEVGKKLVELGYDIVATRGTAKALADAGVDAKIVPKIGEGRPDATDMIKNGEIDLVINTPSGKKPRQHEISIRSVMVARGIPIVTTIAGAKATVFGLETMRKSGATVRSLQEYYE